MTASNDERELIDAVLHHADRTGAYPVATAFRVEHESRRRVIDDLLARGLLQKFGSLYAPTIEGLIEAGSDAARRMVELCNEVLVALKRVYRERPNAKWTSVDLAASAQMMPGSFALAAPILLHRGNMTHGYETSAPGVVEAISLSEGVLDAEPIVWPKPTSPETATDAAATWPRLIGIEVDGYRPFAGFRAEPRSLTVIIGANASGKSSLFDILRFLSFASSNPLPPEIDPASAGKTLFHAGGAERFTIAVTTNQLGKQPLRYEIEILGPIGTPRVVRERLAVQLDPSKANPFLFLDFRGGRGVIRDQEARRVQTPDWNLPANELALRRALDPNLITASRFQHYLSSWAFYGGFDVSPRALIRRPVLTETAPILAEDGSNLSAVLMWMRTEHPDGWDELETHLRSAIPGFASLNVKPRGGTGTVIGTWREDGVPGELTLADLSDGTLRTLCLATLCLSPELPPLMCIDEPELGLHPRVLPTLAGLLRDAAARSQILIATHSPYLLSQFNLDEIAVMRKVDGRSELVRPADSDALRREVEELGGAALAQLHISDELEVRS